MLQYVQTRSIHEIRMNGEASDLRETVRTRKGKRTENKQPVLLVFMNEKLSAKIPSLQQEAEPVKNREVCDRE